jgi:hypothetical protein
MVGESKGANPVFESPSSYAATFGKLRIPEVPQRVISGRYTRTDEVLTNRRLALCHLLGQVH